MDTMFGTGSTGSTSSPKSKKIQRVKRTLHAEQNASFTTTKWRRMSQGDSKRSGNKRLVIDSVHPIQRRLMSVPQKNDEGPE